MTFPHDYMDVAVRRSGGRAMQEQLPSRLSILGQAPSFPISPDSLWPCISFKPGIGSRITKVCTESMPGYHRHSPDKHRVLEASYIHVILFLMSALFGRYM
jgi:hypothetical protein